MKSCWRHPLQRLRAQRSVDAAGAGSQGEAIRNRLREVRSSHPVQLLREFMPYDTICKYMKAGAHDGSHAGLHSASVSPVN